MSVFKNRRTGEETVVCDECGISEHGTKLSPEEWQKIDFTAQMLAEGFPEGSAVEVRDTCPDCGAAEGESS